VRGQKKGIKETKGPGKLLGEDQVFEKTKGEGEGDMRGKSRVYFWSYFATQNSQELRGRSGVRDRKKNVQGTKMAFVIKKQTWNAATREGPSLVLPQTKTLKKKRI